MWTNIFFFFPFSQTPLPSPSFFTCLFSPRTRTFPTSTSPARWLLAVPAVSAVLLSLSASPLTRPLTLTARSRPSRTTSSVLWSKMFYVFCGTFHVLHISLLLISSSSSYSEKDVICWRTLLKDHVWTWIVLSTLWRENKINLKVIFLQPFSCLSRSLCVASGMSSLIKNLALYDTPTISSSTQFLHPWIRGIIKYRPRPFPLRFNLTISTENNETRKPTNPIVLRVNNGTECCISTFQTPIPRGKSSLIFYF